MHSCDPRTGEMEMSGTLRHTVRQFSLLVEFLTSERPWEFLKKEEDSARGINSRVCSVHTYTHVLRFHTQVSMYIDTLYRKGEKEKYAYSCNQKTLLLWKVGGVDWGVV